MAVRPHVVAQVAVSVDGMTSGFAVDQARFYALTTLWQEDVTLIGADTVLAEESALRFVRPRAPQPTEVRAPGPVLAVVDSRARVRTWESLRGLGYWSDVVALYADQTPARPLDSVIPELVAGYDRVDLVEALDLLGSKYGAKVVRADSSGRLLAALLELGLVNELALLIHPVVVGSGRQWAPNERYDLRLANAEKFEGGTVWLRYCI
jgi:2,5-diamino-6-(ribosylamino)-4(3H)-pyrimidinone 5'-phosphate reductase